MGLFARKISNELPVLLSLALGDLNMCIQKTQGVGTPVGLVFDIFITYDPIIITSPSIFTANREHDKWSILYESLSSDKKINEARA